jgi:hypothetical protein
MIQYHNVRVTYDNYTSPNWYVSVAGLHIVEISDVKNVD